MKTYIAYTRVSTARQTQGASLTEQRAAITRYADARALPIVRWYEEVQTAATRGRSVFQRAMRELQAEHASGLILHKVDRGARNLKDWADLGELIDQGIDVRFASDDLDMDTRGGRLSADIQAVVAADYIRNLREEVRKGMQGRLRQGLYPLAAPVGYLDQGGGRTKIPDPVMAPLVIYAFRAFATGNLTPRELAQAMATRNLTSRSGNALSPSALSYLLRSPFYIGVCRVRGIEYRGIHQPLISRELFDQVHRVLARRWHKRRTKHQYRYARRLTCAACSRTLTGERQKTHVYYRCHACPGVSLREDRISEEKEEFQVPGGIIRLRFPRPTCLVEFEKFELP